MLPFDSHLALAVQPSEICYTDSLKLIVYGGGSVAWMPAHVRQHRQRVSRDDVMHKSCIMSVCPWPAPGLRGGPVAVPGGGRPLPAVGEAPQEAAPPEERVSCCCVAALLPIAFRTFPWCSTVIIMLALAPRQTLTFQQGMLPARQLAWVPRVVLLASIEGAFLSQGGDECN